MTCMESPPISPNCNSPTKLVSTHSHSNPVSPKPKPIKETKKRLSTNLTNNNNNNTNNNKAYHAQQRAELLQKLYAYHQNQQHSKSQSEISKLRRKTPHSIRKYTPYHIVVAPSATSNAQTPAMSPIPPPITSITSITSITAIQTSPNVMAVPSYYSSTQQIKLSPLVTSRFKSRIIKNTSLKHNDDHNNKQNPLSLGIDIMQQEQNNNNKQSDLILPTETPYDTEIRRSFTGEALLKPKKMKKIPTKQELQLVLQHYNMAIEKDIESILKLNEPHILIYRDKLFKEAKLNGITVESSDKLRLKVLASVIEYTFMNIEPPNDYTKQTDRKHFKEVAAWTAKMCKDKHISAPLTLIYAAWCHDIERFIPSTKCKYLPEAVDKYRKQIIHAVTSAKVATVLLKGAPVTKQEIDRIYDLILHHDMPHPRDDIVILNNLLIRGASNELMRELEILMDADSFAFFQSTIYFFILFKSKKNSPDWIWERVVNNVKRLRPHLRPKAVECINKLPKDLLSKMSVNQQELRHLCSASGTNSIAQSSITSRCPSDGPDISLLLKNPSNIVQTTLSAMDKIKINETISSQSQSDENTELMELKL